jgi:hypothetical protein
LIDAKVTLTHRRLWPALVQVADTFPVNRLSAITQEHLPSGRHRSTEIPFPQWVPVEDMADAALLSMDEAFDQLPRCLR